MWLIEQMQKLLGRKPPLAPTAQTPSGRVLGGVSRGLEPAGLAAILRQAEQGDLSKQMELFEEIEEKDAFLASLLQTRKQAVLALDYEVLPADDSAEAQRIADQVADLLRNIDLETLLLDLLDATAKGVSVVAMRWEYHRLSRMQLPTEFTWIHPRNLSYDPDSGALRLRTEEDLEDIPYGAALVHQYRAKSGAPTRAGLMRVLSWLYLFKNYAIKDWVTFLEMYGQPLVLGKYDPTASKDELNALKEAVAALGPEGRGVISKATEIEFKEAQRFGSADAYSRFVELIEREMAVAVTGSPLSSFDGAGGSNAMALTLDKISQRLTRSDAKAVYATLRRDLLVPFCHYNFDRADLTPVVEPIIREPEDLRTAAETVKTLVEAGAPIPTWYIHERFQIPAPQPEDEVLDPMRNQLRMASRGRRVRLASGEPVEQARGFVNGMLFVDELIPSATKQAAAIMQADLEQILQVIEQSPDYPTLRRKLVTLYADLDAGALAELLENALVLANLAGRAAVREDF
jgi:phage gp29-like protein